MRMQDYSIEFDLESGFAHEMREGKNIFQVCLVTRSDGKGYKKEIDSRDCGWNDGICGDWNTSVHTDAGYLEEFLKKARKAGIRIK